MTNMVVMYYLPLRHEQIGGQGKKMREKREIGLTLR